MAKEERRKSGSVRDDVGTVKPLASIFPTFFVGLGGAGCKMVNRIAEFVKNSPNHTAYQDLVHYIAIDTDQDQLQHDIPFVDYRYRFLISDFPKAEYVKLKLGLDRREGGDPFFKAWWPDWYRPRPDSTKGAGQIRVESRLALYYQLEDDRLGLVQRIREAINESLDHDNPYRKSRPANVYCHVYGSLVGGTGSGTFLTTAYLMRELLEERRLNPVMTGTFLLPPLFYGKVKPKLVPDIKANGYAALKELEYFMTLGYNRNPREKAGRIEADEEDSIVFNFNPFNRQTNEQTRVTKRPFDTVYLVDEPTGFSLNKDPEAIYPAIAAASYIQLFGSPIIGSRESEEDNYYKKLKSLDGRDFSLGYGAFGLAMLVVPWENILDACTDWLASACLEYGAGRRALSGDEDEAVIAQGWLKNLPAGTNIADDGKTQQDAFNDFCAKQAQAIVDLFNAKHPKLKKALKIDTELGSQKKGYAAVDVEQPITKLKEFSAALEAEGRALADKAREAAAGAVKEHLLAPSEGANDLRRWLLGTVFLALKDDKRTDVTEIAKRIEGVRKQAEQAASKLQELTAKKGLHGLEHLLGDSDFLPARDAYNLDVDRFADEAGKWVAAFTEGEFLAQIKEQLKQAIRDSEKEKGEYEEEAKALKKLADESEKSPDKVLEGAEQDETSEFVLDAEALQGLYTKRRFYRRFYEDEVAPIHGLDRAKADFLKRARENKAAPPTDAKPASGAKPATPEVSSHAAYLKALKDEIRSELAKSLMQRRASDAAGRYDLWSMLRLEAKYDIAAADAANDPDLKYVPASRQDQALADRTRELEGQVSEEQIKDYVGKKLEFVARKAQILARLRSTETLAVDPMNFVAISKANRSTYDEITKDRDLLNNKKDVPWNDDHRIAFFTSQVGLPVHNFYPVNGELREAYEKIFGLYVRSKDFPSHIDKQFEDPKSVDIDELLPSLEPGRSPRVSDSAMTAFIKLWALGALKVSDDEGAEGQIAYAIADSAGRKLERELTRGPGRQNLFTAYSRFRKELFPDRLARVDDAKIDELAQHRKLLEGWIKASDLELARKGELAVRAALAAVRTRLKIRHDDDLQTPRTSRRDELEARLRERIGEVVDVIERDLLRLAEST